MNNRQALDLIDTAITDADCDGATRQELFRRLSELERMMEEVGIQVQGEDDEQYLQ